MQMLSVCPFCDGVVVQHWENPSFVRCAKCGAIWRDPFPNEEELISLYDIAWDAPEENTNETGNMDSALAQQYLTEAMKSLGLSDLKGLHLLDFGAGKGALILALQSRGAICTGLAPFGYEKLASYGIQAFDKLATLPQGELYDGIFCMDVVEHLRRPWEAFAELRARLRPSGWLILSTPNPSGLNALVRSSRWRETQKPGHILFTGEHALRAMLERAGFTSIRPMSWNVKYGRSPMMDKVINPFLSYFKLGGAVRLVGFNG